MFDYSRQIYLIINMILITLFTATISNVSNNFNYDSKQLTNIYRSSMFSNLEETPDEIARGPEGAIISIIEQSKDSKK